ncbi:MAG: endonuclease/exonuclease/phosphatase family protein [Pseudomonadota bacterium]
MTPWLDRLFWVVVMGCVLLLFGPPDLFRHFWLHGAIVAPVFGAAAFVARASWRGTILCSFAALFAFITVPAVLFEGTPSRSMAADEQAMTIVTFNLLKLGLAQDEKIAFLGDADADIILIQEGIGNDDVMARLSALYPHHSACDGAPPCGLFIFSRFPLQDGETIRHSGGGRVAIRARADVNGVEVGIVNVHLPTPAHEGRVEGFDALEAAICRAGEAGPASGPPLLVAGDFNTTQFTAALFLCRPNEYQISRLGGYHATWPWPLGPFGIPIDHIVLTFPFGFGPVTVPRRWLGSDHAPLVATVYVPAPVP